MNRIRMEMSVSMKKSTNPPPLRYGWSVPFHQTALAAEDQTVPRDAP